MIPPIYILINVVSRTSSRGEVTSGVFCSGAAGSARGRTPHRRLVTSGSAARRFCLQVLLVAWIVVLARKIVDPARLGPNHPSTSPGAVLSASGRFLHRARSRQCADSVSARRARLDHRGTFLSPRARVVRGSDLRRDRSAVPAGGSFLSISGRRIARHTDGCCHCTVPYTVVQPRAWPH